MSAYTVEIKVHICQATVKQLSRARQEALRAGDLRVIRRITALLDLRHQSVAEVAEGVGMSETTIYRWLHAFSVHGLASLRYRTSPGRPAKLTPSQKERLDALLRAGPAAAGYATAAGMRR